MKHLLTLFTTSTLLAFSLNSFAHQGCPPVSVVKNENLTQATRLDNKHWSFNSDLFSHASRVWHVLFITELATNNKQEALQKGRERFRQAIATNNDPSPENRDGISYCYYTSTTGKDSLAAMSFVEDG